MTKKLNLFFLWFPRVILIMFICFISVFALDVFGEGWGLVETAIAFFMHLLPSFVLGIILYFSWNRFLLGGWLFLVLGLFFTVFFDLYEDIFGFLILGLPLFIVSLFSFLNYFNNKKPKA